MIYRRIYDPALAQASYLVGCDETREAVLVDPERDIDRYEREAEDAGVRIVAVAETHLHADFVSGVRAFVASRPVTAYLSGVGDRAPWTAEGRSTGARRSGSSATATSSASGRCGSGRGTPRATRARR